MGALRTCAVMCSCTMFIIAASLVGSSFGFLKPNELGIVQNTVSKTIDDTRIYTGGRYFLGLGKSFLIYPTGKQNIYFGTSTSATFGSPDASPIVVRVPQGQVTIEASLQYSLNASPSLIGLYRNFQMDYHRRLVTLASSTVQTALQQLQINDFFTNRTLVTELTVNSLQAAFSSQYADFQAFQLRKITLPSSNEAQIVQKILSGVRQATASIVQTQQQVDAQTTVIVGQIDQEITVYVANKSTEANVITNTADAEATSTRLASESGAYVAFQQILGFNNSELLRYLYYRHLWNAGVGVKVVGGFEKVTGLV